MKDRNSIVLEDFISSCSEPTSVLRKLKARIIPSRTRLDINDKLIKYVFNLSDSGTEALINGETFNIVEKRDYKNVGDILTAYRILNASGYVIQRPFREFDRDVLSVCISEQAAGNWCTTINIIYRGLTGKVGRGDAEPSKDQRAAILDSVKLLMSRTIQYNASDLCEALGYNNRQPIKANDLILPAWYIEHSTANGKDSAVIFFERECPLLKLARAKKQILTYDASLLDIPRQQNTKMNIELKNYAIRRVLEVSAHKQMQPILTFNDIFSKCHIDNANHKAKLDARRSLIRIFEYLKERKIIRSFSLSKVGNTFNSVKFVA